MAFDIAGARKEGYSDAEIADYLASSKNYDAAAARKEGYSDAEIISHLSTEKPTVLERAGRVAGLGARAIAKGVTAIPTLMADAAGEVINAAGGNIERPSTALERAFDRIGLPRPANAVERISSDVTGALAGVGGQLAAARSMAAPAAAVPTSGQRIAETLAQQPGRQLTAAATGPGAASLTRELGGGPVAQTVAGIAGGAAPFVPQMLAGKQTLSAPVAREGREAGYAIPPAEMRPNLINNTLEGFSGKLQTRQVASYKNQRVTNTLASKALGLPEGETITSDALDRIRSQAGKAYQAIKSIPSNFKTDKQFADDLSQMGKDFAVAAREFPELAGNSEIDAIRKSLTRGEITPTGGMELIKKLRFDASKNYKNFADPAKAALADAQKTAANAIESLIERNLLKQGNPELVQEFRNARQLIAKSYDIEAALNPADGNVSAQVLARALKKGSPYTGELKTIAKFGATFPNAAKSPEQIGSVPGISPLDFVSSGIYGGVGGMAHPAGYAAAAIPFLRPAVRGAILSNTYQNAATPLANPLSKPDAIGLSALPNLYAPR